MTPAEPVRALTVDRPRDIRATPSEIGTILVATDLGPVSEAAVNQAIALAARLRARLLVISVIESRHLGNAGGLGARFDQVRDKREQGAGRIVERGRQAGVSVRFLVWEGEAGEAILDAASAEGVDMIVVGTRGRGGMERLLMGSVSEHVVRHASVPVLVVRPTLAAAGA